MKTKLIFSGFILSFILSLFQQGAIAQQKKDFPFQSTGNDPLKSPVIGTGVPVGTCDGVKAEENAAAQCSARQRQAGEL